ncbi:MAG: hypothetical protein HFI88_10080 [Lachnospiraceae bacterium]|nr:hypothetical protein [Lachnospiraceae bacterium]
MINRNSKRLLKFLRKSQPDYEDEVFTYDFIEENYPLPIEKVFPTIRFLEKNGYLIIATLNGVHFGVVLTELALHSHEFVAEEIKSFLFRSILTPIVVSFSTTVLTLCIQWLLTTP